MAITNKIGSPVTGEDFFGRANELTQAHRYLNENQSLLLSAPRRIGKSSFAKRLVSDKTDEGWQCVYIDLQGIATKEAFIRKLLDSFSSGKLIDKTAKKVSDFFYSTFNSVDGMTIGSLKINLNHRDELESTYDRLSDTIDYSRDTLIVIDELPLFLGKQIDDGNNSDEVEFLLNWFRSIRQKEKSHLRWLFCGSVGLRNFTNHYRMSQTINDLIDFELGELPHNEAEGLLTALAESYNLSLDERVRNKTLDLLQWPIPYFIQLLIDRLITRAGKPSAYPIPIEIEDIESSIDELSHSDYFMTWDERLDEYRDLEELSRKLLDNISITDDGLTKEELHRIAMKGQAPDQASEIKSKLTKVLEMLEHDGYIIRSGDKRKFRSPLLRKWWNYKFID